LSTRKVAVIPRLISKDGLLRTEAGADFGENVKRCALPKRAYHVFKVSV